MGGAVEEDKREETTILATLRADLAAGIDRDVIIKRALSAGIARAAVGELFGLSCVQAYQIAGPRRFAPKQQRQK